MAGKWAHAQTMPPHARPLAPSAESSATSTPAGDPLIIRMEGLPPERPKAYAFLQRRKAREIPPPSAPTQSSSSAVAQVCITKDENAF
jgi:hypothetical protein